jgi:hypothetical protein
MSVRASIVIGTRFRPAALPKGAEVSGDWATLCDVATATHAALVSCFVIDRQSEVLW